MQAVGRLGSYISKGVYTVSGPFHAFGGAVDMVVVEQPDGSYKSSPWYVKFGKFQGVLKTKEKVVTISVNGVEADFNMYLDHRGEAYFLKEDDIEEGESTCSPPSSSGEDADRQSEHPGLTQSNSLSYGSNRSGSTFNGRNRRTISRMNSRRPQILGLDFGRRSMKNDEILEEVNGSSVVRTESMERAEIAADLLELKWSTNLASPRCSKDNTSQILAEDTPKDVNGSLRVDDCPCDEANLVEYSENSNTVSTVEENGVSMKCLTTLIGNVGEDSNMSDSESMMLTQNMHLTETCDHENPVTIISGITKSISHSQDPVNKHTVLSDSSFSKVEGITDNSEPLCYRGKEEINVHTETAHSISWLASDIKSEPQREVLSGQELLNIPVSLRKEDFISSSHEEKISSSEDILCSSSENVVLGSYSEDVSIHLSQYSVEEFQVQSTIISSSRKLTCMPVEERAVSGQDQHGTYFGLPDDLLMLSNDCVSSSSISEEEPLVLGEMEGLNSIDTKHSESTHEENDKREAPSSVSGNIVDVVDESSHGGCIKTPLDQSVIDDYIDGANLQRTRARPISRSINIKKTDQVHIKEITRMVKSLPNISPLGSDFEASDLGRSFNPAMRSGVVSFQNNSSQLHWAQPMAEGAKIMKDNTEGPPNLPIGQPPLPSHPLRGKSQRSWPFPFNKSRSTSASQYAIDGNESSDATKILKSKRDMEGEKVSAEVKGIKKKVRTKIPTSEQLASLKLKEGKNIVIFTFSTAMLGKQQVDAHIFLWRWNTRIVISDVDGTITRSDLLGQVMPLVGMDWSQTGVAHLFSAIKENGYQLLFLSARSISQAFLTRQFLFNIKQDGKALPEGPVVISPDGLFPSLFREVVRRAPHEFKIACLEDIKKLFPADVNPFYAGFGNRDTDEFSYLKVGIPRGKIFIINPKGEIVVNRRVDTKSYTSLHSLVHGMFPTMSSSEQEDFNSWNYWRLPPPLIDV